LPPCDRHCRARGCVLAGDLLAAGAGLFVVTMIADGATIG
jgi:hypothetical protein